MERRVECGRNGTAIRGGRLALSLVEIWVMSDAPVLERLRDIVRNTDGFQSSAPTAVRVRGFVTHLLYEDDGSTYRSTWGRFYDDRFATSGFNSRMPTNVRGDIHRSDFIELPWAEFIELIMEGVDA